MARSELDSLIDTIANYDFGDIQVGASLNDAGFYNSLAQMQINS